MQTALADLSPRVRRDSDAAGRDGTRIRAIDLFVLESGQKHEELPLAAEPARRDGQRGSDFSVGTHLTEERLVGPGKNPLEFPILRTNQSCTDRGLRV